MIVKNKVKIQAIIAVVCGVVNVILSFILSSVFGAVGACLSICAAYTLRAVAYHIVHGKVMRFNMWQFIKQCYLRVLPVMIITAAFGILLNYFVADAGWVVLFIKIVAVAAVYLAAAFVFCFSRRERRDAIEKIKNRLLRRNRQPQNTNEEEK